MGILRQQIHTFVCFEVNLIQLSLLGYEIESLANIRNKKCRENIFIFILEMRTLQIEKCQIDTQPY